MCVPQNPPEPPTRAPATTTTLWRALRPVHMADRNAQSSLLHAANRGTAWEPKHLLRSRRSARSE